jgi:translocation and assembly module TamB
MSLFSGNTFRKAIFWGLPLMLFLVVAIVLSSVYWLFNSASGAAWVWSKLEGLESVDVRSSQISGDLASGLIIHNMEYRSSGLDLLVRHTELEAEPGWWPLSIQVDRLSLNEVEVMTRSTEDSTGNDDGGPDIRSILAGIEIPLPLIFNDVVLTGISFQQDDQPASPLAESVRLKATLDKRLVVDSLDVQTTELDAKLQGNLGFESPFALAVTVEGRFEKVGEAGQVLIEVPFQLEGSGNLDKLQLILNSQKFGLQASGEILEPVSSPAWDVQVMLERLQWPQDQIKQEFALRGLNLNSKGTMDSWTFIVSSDLDAGKIEDANFTVSGSGTTSEVKVAEANIAGPGMDLDFIGKLDWSRQPTADLRADIRQLDLSPWVSNWPAGEKLAGNLELKWSGNSLEIPASQLTVTGTELLVAVEADIDVETNRVEGQLDWRNLSWPLKDETPGFSSESGRLHISGTVDEWLAEGQLVVKMGDYPQGSFQIQGGGNRTATTFRLPRGEILGGTLSGRAEADWSKEVQWSAAIQTQGIDPEPLLPGWPGHLDSDIEVSAKGQPQQISVNLLALQGSLRDVPVFAHGGLDIKDSSLVFHSLEIGTDEAEMTLDGNAENPDGVVVKFSGKLPSALLQGASGSLELNGRYSSFDGQPSLELDLQALDIAWNDLSIGNLAVSTADTPAAGGLPIMQLDAIGLGLSEVLLDELSLSLSPVGDQFELKTNLLGEGFALTSRMSLESRDRSNMFSADWQGELGELELVVGPAYRFELSKPASFALSSGSTQLGPVCLSENMESSLCLDIDFQSIRDWSLVADATAIPVNYFRDLLELDIHFEQLIDGRLEWHQPLDQPPTGGADFRITAGKIMDLLDDDILTETREGRFAFKLQNGNLESGVLDLKFPGTGFIDVDFDVLDIAIGGAREIQGRAIAQLEHFKLAGQMLLPGVDTVDGQFESNILLGGTVADPKFNGSFRFSNGLIYYAPIGLRLEDIEAEGQLTRGDRGEVKGQFRAGEGVASLSGRFLFEDIGSAQLDIDVAGEQLLLVNTDTLKILTETELKLVLGPKRMDINGRILIPSASLTPDNLLLGEVRDSEDLIIETPGTEVAPNESDVPEQDRIYGQLEVSFGDDVFIKVPGVETNITGTTLFTWDSDPVPLAKGAYTLQGTVDVYGPRLTINNGSISFPSVPANNPLLNIRAGRDIFGNTQIRSAGVRVIGTLKRPVLEAYTVPATNEDRAWTLLVTGSDFDQGQGVSGFDVGTYIAPRLYISYGISLFEDENVISARYDIKKGFGVKVTSGQRETGLDVSYTIDK